MTFNRTSTVLFHLYFR